VWYRPDTKVVFAMAAQLPGRCCSPARRRSRTVARGTTSSPTSLSATLRASLPATLLASLLGAAGCFGDRPVCSANCAIEVECGFRSLEACEAASCDPLTGLPTATLADACLAAAGDCLDAAACACDDGCARIDTCAESGETDSTCVSTCATLVEQQSTQTYLEYRCRIEADDCSTLATCSSVSG